MDLRDTVAVVTGASAGIGLATARALAREGCKVALVARKLEPLRAAAAAVGPSAILVVLDVTDREGARSAFERVRRELGPLRILVNNAAFNARGPVHDTPAEDLARVVETNLVAPVYLVRRALDFLEPPGAIVNVASLAGMVPVPGEAAYSASKAGLRAFSMALGDELRDRGITVSSVCPGPVETGFLLDHLDEAPDLVFSQPMSTADEVAEAIVGCVREGWREVAIPAMSGRLSTLGYLFPALRRTLTPVLERIGAHQKARYRARR